ncbi:MAG: hypothetical protein L0Z46_10895 [Nitrospiraceae bacterium]|nr:hypothetical protein [Nitrospiraceae bacterium]
MSQARNNAAYHVRNAKAATDIQERVDYLIKAMEQLIAAVAALEKD